MPVSQARLAVDADGGVWLAWDDRRAETPAGHLAAVRNGAIRHLDAVVTAGQSPALAAAADVVLAWHDDGRARARTLMRR